MTSPPDNLEPLSAARRPPWSLARLIYTGLGLGLAPKAPGTFGTLLGIPIFWLIEGLGWQPYLAVTLAVFFIGWWAARRAETDLGRHDAPQVVIDEVAGYLVTMLLAPALPFNWLWGFAFFRLFDIVKPWPVSWADQKLPGGLGVMVDDVLAGVYAWLAMQLSFILIF
ncbi:phosphatidylglycerophosphatase A [Deltaproteobacteria bacterium Smac51]|nr:phosphatidylglycerophosphatase A [Deltaproteobacteria bacterium Smac51]